jgi:beta-mannanase
MKLLEIDDNRLFAQLVSLLVLVLLPITMITFNGFTAIRGVMGMMAYRTEDGRQHTENCFRANWALAVNASQRVESHTEEATASKSITRESLKDSTACVQFGVFDPQAEFAEDRNLRLRHVYVSWCEYQASELTSQLAALEASGYQILLTIEPWSRDASGEDTLLQSVIDGQYDDIIRGLAQVLDQIKGPVLVTWGHEMDQDLISRYPWSGKEPDHFVNAYRHVVNQFRSLTDTEILWVWNGVIKSGSEKYWPGNEYVDVVGIPVYSFPHWDQQFHGYIRDFSKTLGEKWSLIESFEKPFIITELGVSGSADFSAFWLHNAIQMLERYQKLKAVVFFYSRDVEGAWGNDLPTPDWRVHPDVIRGLVEWHQASSKRDLEKPNEFMHQE